MTILINRNFVKDKKKIRKKRKSRSRNVLKRIEKIFQQTLEIIFFNFILFFFLPFQIRKKVPAELEKSFVTTSHCHAKRDVAVYIYIN